MKKVPTGISEACWCCPSLRADPNCINPAVIENISKTNPQDRFYSGISWFDELLEGGILIPDDDDERNAITLLLTGPPGSGKSTLSMELAYRWLKKDFHTLYVTSESSVKWLQRKARSYGWALDEEIFHKLADRNGIREQHHIDILETRDFQTYLEKERVAESRIGRVLESIGGFWGKDSPIRNTQSTVREFVRDINIEELLRIQSPDILVVDSLNTIREEKRADLLERYKKLIEAGPKLIIIILDSGRNETASEFWGYLCDIIIRLDRKYDFNYMVRTLEIVKARYQTHAWGVHQLKIYEPTDYTQFINHEQIRRSHPFRKEGGIFIFPSIHYFLSNYKRSSPESPPGATETKLDNLNKMLNGGFPKGRCIGFTGLRGGHKSHLGYSHILHKVIQAKNAFEARESRDCEKGIIISLRDDEGMARQTLEKILDQEFAENNLDMYLSSDLLDIIYYPPGYITPEEFFHRMYISIQRLKCDDRYENVNITLLFNSLDQLNSRFPLCAEEKIFIPGIIETLMAEGITSIFIGVEEPGQPPEQYGLLSMADLILSFKQHKIAKKDYLGHLDFEYRYSTRLNAVEIDKISDKIGNARQTVVVSVVRFAGGQAAGSAGILELIDEHSELQPLYNKTGLCFTIFSPSHSQGEVIKD